MYTDVKKTIYCNIFTVFVSFYKKNKYSVLQNKIAFKNFKSHQCFPLSKIIYEDFPIIMRTLNIDIKSVVMLLRLDINM